MKNLRRAGALLALIVFTVLLAGEAHAQMGGMGGMGGMGRRGMGGGAAPGNNDCRPVQTPPDTASATQINFHLAQLQDALHLRPDQGAAWQVFAGRVHALADDVARERGRVMDLRPGADTGPLPGMKHVSQAVDAARNRVTLLEGVVAATDALYKTFTPEQASVADLHVREVVAPKPFAPAETFPGSVPPPPPAGLPPAGPPNANG